MSSSETLVALLAILSVIIILKVLVSISVQPFELSDNFKV